MTSDRERIEQLEGELTLANYRIRELESAIDAHGASIHRHLVALSIVKEKGEDKRTNRSKVASCIAGQWLPAVTIARRTGLTKKQVLSVVNMPPVGDGVSRRRNDSNVCEYIYIEPGLTVEEYSEAPATLDDLGQDRPIIPVVINKGGDDD